jgi:hypothetical protein
MKIIPEWKPETQGWTKMKRSERQTLSILSTATMWDARAHIIDYASISPSEQVTKTLKTRQRQKHLIIAKK